VTYGKEVRKPPNEPPLCGSYYPGVTSSYTSHGIKLTLEYGQANLGNWGLAPISIHE